MEYKSKEQPYEGDDDQPMRSADQICQHFSCLFYVVCDDGQFDKVICQAHQDNASRFKPVLWPVRLTSLFCSLTGR